MPTSVDGWHQCELLTCAVKDIKDIFKRVRKVVVSSLSLSRRFKWMCFLWVEIDNEWQSECVNVCGVFWEMVTGRGLNFLSPWGRDTRGWHLKFISYTSSAAVDSLEAQVSMCLCALWWICLNLRANRGNVFVITGSTWWETLRGHQVIDKFCALLCFPFGGGERFKQVFCVLKTAINMAGCWKTALF